MYSDIEWDDKTKSSVIIFIDYNYVDILYSW